jgi:hypothetical protein
VLQVLSGAWSVAVPVLVAAMALGGCGGDGGDGTTEEDRVVTAVERMQRALAQGRAGEVCAAMTDEAKRQIGTIGHDKQPISCDFDLRVMLKSNEQTAGDGKDLQSSRKPRVLEVRVAPGGGTATTVLTLGGDPFQMRLAKEDGTWKLDDFFGAQGPVQPELR